MNIKEMTIHNCACGKEHLTDMEHVDISQGAIRNIPDYLKSIDAKSVYLVADRNTYCTAGKQLEELLKAKGINHDCYVISDENEVVPNETTMIGILIGIKKKYDLIIAIGTGTINDMCKFISSRLNIDYIICATAPSMDGFASIGAALMINNLKTTIDCHVPKAIFADIDILKEAPMIMIQAGLGDIIGKYTCLCDWKLSSIINNEYYCEEIVSMVKHYIDKVVETAPQVPSRSPEAIAAITEALVGTGIAMSFVGNSRPASGSEHHISHYWEMKFLFEHRTPALHGIKVGIGTVAILRLYEMLIEEPIDFEEAKASIAAFDTEKWKEKMHKSYGVSANGIIALEEDVQKNSKTAHAKRIQVIEEKWPDIIAMIKQELPSAAFVTSILEEIGAPTNPAQVGVEPSLVADSIVVAKEVRNRYGLLQLLWDLGIADEMGDRISKYFQA